MLPESALNLTGTPLTTLLAASRTRAVSVTLPVPFELNCGLLTRRSIRLGGGVPPVPAAGGVTVIEVDPATLELVVWARTVSAPPTVPAVYCTVTCPLPSVVPLWGLSDAPLALVD